MTTSPLWRNLRLSALLASLAAAPACSTPVPRLGEPDPIPPPPPRTTTAAPSPQSRQWPGGAANQEVGRRPEVPPPRYGVAVFASAPGASGGPRPHSEEWTGKLVELLGEQRVAASAVKLGGSLEGDREQTEPALAKLAGGAAPAGVDILIAGAVELDRTTRVWLVAIDSRQGRQAARAAFEGEESGMNVARRAATELVKGMQVYWFDCDRGRLTASPLLVEGLRHPEDIRLLLEAFPGVPGIERARHTSTQVVPGGEMAGAEYQLFTSLDPAALEKALAGVKWHSPGGTASVVPGSPGRSLVRYESP